MQEQKEVLSSLIEFLEPEIGKNAIKDWFPNAKVVYENGYVLKFPNKFVYQWANNHYAKQICLAANKIGVDIKISYAQEGETSPVASVSSEADFNSNFTFDNFIVGKSNEMAFEAASRVAKSKNIIFNPLFIYGGVGLGKTHLMHAIANLKRQLFPKKRITYLSAEEFMNSFIRALQQRSVMSFKEEFRSADILIIDDFQFLGKKEATQEEFFHTFNSLLEQKKQLIISADQPPSDLPGIEARLKSRLGWGLVVDVHPASYELRLSILKAKAEKMQIEIEDEVITYIAETMQNSIRELEGALIRVVKFSEWMKRPLNLELAEQVLQNISNRSPKKPEEILKFVSKHMQVEIEELKGASRKRPIVRARQKAVYILRNFSAASYITIAKILGNKDHTSIMYAEQQAKKFIKEDAMFAHEIKEIEEKLNRH